MKTWPLPLPMTLCAMALMLGCGGTDVSEPMETPASEEAAVHAAATCSAFVGCSDGTTRSCTGSSQYSCESSPGCYAACDSILYWCRNPTRPCE